MDSERTQRMSKWIATVEEARTMMQRRGYHVGEYVLEDDNTFVGSIAYGAKRRPGFDGGLGLVSVNHNTKLEIEQMLDMIRGQHHMQCGQCGEPVLRKEVLNLNRPVQWKHVLDRQGRECIEPDANDAHRLFPEYRAVASGPDSEPIEKCPGCGLLLSECAREIDDSKEGK